MSILQGYAQPYTAAILSATAPAATNAPFLALRPGQKPVGIRGIHACVQNAAGSKLLFQRIRAAVATMAGTALSIDPVDNRPPVEPASASLILNGSAAGDVQANLGELWIPGNTTPGSMIGENFLSHLIGRSEVGLQTFAKIGFNGGAAPVNDGWQYTLTWGGVAHIFEAQSGGGTDTATKHFFVPGATYALAAAALIAKINAVVGHEAATLFVDSIQNVYVEKNVPGPNAITAVAETTDAGNDSALTDNMVEWLALTASATNAIAGILEIYEMR